MPTNFSCNYTGIFSEDLIYYEPTTPVPEIVRQILQATNSEQNFELLQCNVESVAAISHNGKRYLLYSLEFFLSLPRTEGTLAYGIIAHEIGHHINEHVLDPAFREKEELEADLFMGYALFKLRGGAQLSKALQIPNAQSYTYKIDPALREDAIRRGWERSSLYVQVQENMAFGGNDVPALHLPYFNPPKDCQRQTICERLKSRHHTIGDVNIKLRQALQATGYEQRSYFQTSGGFALVTQLEQFHSKDGTPKSGQNRWKDYPVRENSDDLWEYFKSLIYPSPGNFRIFVFIISDQPFGLAQRTLEKKEAVEWLGTGLNCLPKGIADMPLNEGHYMDVLVYEFEAAEGDWAFKQKWPGTVQCSEHLEKTGLARVLKY